jgi:nicotinamide riboside transporter PnuC
MPTLFNNYLVITVGSVAGVITNLVTDSFLTGCINTIVYAALAWGTKLFLDHLRSLYFQRKGGRNG